MTSAAETHTCEADETAEGKLKRNITGPLLFLFILGDVLGAGIYALMGVLSTMSVGCCGRRCSRRCCWPC